MSDFDTSQFVAPIAGLVCASACLTADIRRRKLPAGVLLGAAVSAAIVVAAYFFALSRWPSGEAALLAMGCGAAAVLAFSRVVATKAFILADLSAFSLSAFAAADFFALLLFSASAAEKNLAVSFAVSLLIALFLWTEGRAVMQWQRPDGIAAAEFLILASGFGLTREWLGHSRAAASSGWHVPILIVLAAGLGLLALVLRSYFGTREEHRIIEHIGKWGEGLQPEYSAATPECPFPERWKMYDTMTAEAEVLEFLTCLATTLKPNLIVETGSFSGISTLAFAEGLRRNGFGKIVSCEFDPVVYAKASERIAASGLAEWIDLRNESSLDMSVEGSIDLLFCDSDEKIREFEVRRFIDRINPHGVILMHDASSHFGIVRKGALALEQEGIISVVFLPTPRGLVVAQKARGSHPQAREQQFAVAQS